MSTDLRQAISTFAIQGSEAHRELKMIIEALVTVPDDDLSQAMTDALLRPADVEILEYAYLLLGRDYINFKEIDASGRINLPYYLVELFKMNGTTLWRNVLALIAPDDMADEVLRQAGFKLALGNKQFYGLAVTVIGLSLIYGGTLRRRLHPIPARFNYIVRAALALSEGAEPVGSPEQLLVCLRQLYGERGPKSAFVVLSQEKAFVNDCNMDYVTFTCPAITLTKKLFQAYGQTLLDLRYATYFLERVADKDPQAAPAAGLYNLSVLASIVPRE